ncbi:MAG: hypothetical protein RIC56_12195 [Pseudomonadales bacterium]
MSRLVLAAALLLGGTGVEALDVDARLKYFATLSALPDEDLQRQRSGTPAFDDNLDLRLLLREEAGAFRIVADHSTTLVRGDALDGTGFGVTLDQTVADDSRRALDLTWTLDDGGNHRLFQRFDRLALQYRQGPWAATVGRQAVSWGNGLVFQPLDLFNPFAPTTVDQDYKAGDDLLLLERSLREGGSLQLLAVARRDDADDVTADAGSLAAKWHRFVGQGELELVAGRHHSDRVFGTALRFPLGGALLRSDLVATRLEAGTWKLSGIVNLDYSLVLGQRNVYLFGEYFHNAFGVRRLPDDPAGYPIALTDRLARGELFNLMRDYLAAGWSIEWHPLWSQTLTLIGNLNDGSVLLQTQLSHEPGDHQRLELGVVEPLGGAGKEFGGVPVAGRALTVGGGTRVYLRWAYYF